MAMAFLFGFALPDPARQTCYAAVHLHPDPCRLPIYSLPSPQSANPFPPSTPVGCQPTAFQALKVPIPSFPVGCQPAAFQALKGSKCQSLPSLNPCSKRQSLPSL